MQLPKDLGPMDVYRLLPGDNCGECGIKTCMGFATNLLERKGEVDDCPPMREPERKEEREKLIEMLTPPVRPIVIGEGDNAIEIGGEEVIYRHERTWYNPPPMMIDVHDQMNEEELLNRVEWISDYSRIKIGQKLSFDGIAIRSSSCDSSTFQETVRLVTENTEYPITLCSHNPDVLESGLEALEKRRPLLYAATTDNWDEVADLAVRYDCPFTISSPDLDELVEISTKALAGEVKDDQIVLNPWTDPTNIRDTLYKLVKLRRAAIEDEFESLRFPLVGVPLTAWLTEDNEIEAAFMEGATSCILISNSIDMLILHSDEIWSLMPSMVLRQDLYQDPRNPASVEPELNEVGNPDENSPILITGNFALTYYTVEGDVEGIDCYIYPVDTDGTSVTSAIAGDLMTADQIVDAIKEENFGEKVSHNTIILPGEAAVLSGQIEVDSGWNVMVGPKDSSQIKDFLKENWPPKKE
ncbi:hypothetical protein AKJ64_00980 [candidate division MSBL1 archaeon SCGC-AAA259E17]|uniref:4Fe-4S domain-containing protein n=1 Tax=candidate division MSBL1 archaeon SCGC-AAA259E17 TaxID=1698263 RepID=A0A133UGP5_9EURY|nr:hypothetical protein AKJ64_00980 [candidate division MSBL1 archaeon SCGC-AAA259E17]